jgi:tricarballylate dehydrogenase
MRFQTSRCPPITAARIRGLAARRALDPEALEATVSGVNAAVRNGILDHTILDDGHTKGLDPPKTHWGIAILPPSRLRTH